MPNFAPSGRAMPCTSATELLVKAMPASSEPSRHSRRASASSGLANATGRNRASLPAARKEKSMVSLVALRDTQDSMAWVKASTPVAAVSAGGIPYVSRGSRMAISGTRYMEMTSSFSWAASSVMIVVPETSLPEPAVVGMAMIGTPGCGTLPTPA